MMTAGCKPRHDEGADSSGLQSANESDVVKLTKIRRPTDDDLNQLKVKMFADSTHSDNGWGKFGNCSFTNMGSYSGPNTEANLTEVVERAIYGRRGISFKQYKKENLKRVGETSADAVYAAMTNHLSKKSMNDDEKEIASDIRRMITKIANNPKMKFWTGQENFDHIVDDFYYVGAVVDTKNKEVIVAATGNCEQLQDPGE